MEFDREKFKRLVHYVIWRAGGKPGFGATKLNKVLWFADARVFQLTGKPITGEKYTRGEFGPIPYDIMPVRGELEKAGVIEITKRRHFNHDQTRFHARIRPDVSIFSPEELKEVDWWIAHIDEEHTAISISDESHDYAWEIASMGEEIPYHAIFAVRLREPNEEELEWAKNRAKELGLP